MTDTSAVPNLDAMPHDELIAFYERHKHGAHAMELFPAGGRRDAAPCARSLACYAKYKATAMRYRLDGRIQLAVNYENLCDTVYGQLPPWAMW